MQIICGICGHLDSEHAEISGHSHLGNTVTGFCGCVLSKEQVRTGRGNIKPFSETKEAKQLKTLMAATTIAATGKSGGVNGYAKLSEMKVVVQDDDGKITVKLIPITSKGEIQVDADITIDSECMDQIAQWYLNEATRQGW